MFFEVGFPTATVWGWLKDAAPNAGYAIAAVMLGALLVVVVGLVVLQFTTRIKRLRGTWPAKQILRPRLQIESLHDEALKERLGPPVGGLIRGRVTWQRDRFGLNLVSGQAGVASALSSLAKASDQAKAAVAVIEFLTALLPRRKFVVSGELQPAGAHGVGISLELTCAGGFDALITFWADAFCLERFEAKDAYQYLAVAAAAWIDFKLATSVDSGDMLTGDPESWAYFRSGVEWQRLGDPERARTLYEQALAKDGRNVGALANLGILSRREHEWMAAWKYLERAQEEIKPAPDASLTLDENPDWYRIRYQFAALKLNRAAARRAWRND